MIIKFKLFERQDVEKAQITRKASEIIMTKLKEHIKKHVDKAIEIPYSFKLSPYFICKIGPIGMGAAVYAMPVDNEDKYRELIIRNENLFKYISTYNDKAEVNTSREYTFQHNTQEPGPQDYDSKPVTYNQIKWSDILSTIYHEIVHRYDDLKYDLKKVDSKLVGIFNKYSGDTKAYIKKYSEEYTKNTGEYNAYFISAINFLKDDVKNGKYSIPNNFKDFKVDFEQYIGTNLYNNKNYSFFADSEKFRKHLNKRIFDLWTKIQERGIKGI